jgi:Carboxypeptidase regulatory-like domain
MAVNESENALVVKVFAYPTTDFGNRPSDPGVQPVSGVDVAITAGPSPGSQVTGPDGEVRFENLTEPAAGGTYTIRVSVPSSLDFEMAPAGQDMDFFVNGQRRSFTLPSPAPDPVVLDIDRLPVREGREVLVEVGLVPKAGTLTGKVTGVPSPGGIRVEARNGLRLVDFAATGAAGDFTLTIDEPGLIEVRPAASVDRPNRSFVPKAGHASRFLFVGPGKPVDLTALGADIEYEATKAQVVVGARLVDDRNGQPELRPLDGVTFRLFKQGEDKPLQELVTQLNVENAFRGLEPDSYRIEALPPAANNGQRLQLTRPSTLLPSITVGDGERIDLTQEFEFKPTRGSVAGSVIVSGDGRPVDGVAVVLSSFQDPQMVRRKVTNEEGEYEIVDLLPGKYRVALEQDVVTALGTRWEQEGERGRTVEVGPRATTFVPEFRLVEEEHLITGQVLGPGGVGAPFVTVQIFKDIATAQNVNQLPAGDPLLPDTVLTDQDGIYRYRAPAPGTYFVRVLEQDGFAPQLTPVTVRSSTTAPPLFTSPRPSGGGGGTGTSGGSPTPVPELNDFPFLTEEVDLGDRGGAAPTSSGVGAVGQTVERALREVLGWRPRASDPKGFQAALLQAFTVEEVAGHTEVRWNPRSYAVEIQADLGAITGAQASLYTRAKGALDQIKPLLEGLTPLRVDYDPENVDAIRAIVRSHLNELVTELGVEGGPRVQRVDQLFAFLLGETAVDDLGLLRDPDKVGGSLGILRDRFGLQRHRINTIDEEQAFTNFLVLVDHVVSLAESWDAQRVFFVRGSTLVEPFLGTQLVLVSRDLEVVAESVHEVEFAMNSVFLGPSERQTLELRFPPGSASSTLQRKGLVAAEGSPPMFVSELLAWVERFATEEGRQLIDEGGKQGVAAFRPTILLLEALVRDARVAPAGAQDPRRMPDAYRRPRVQRALTELASQLASTAARVELIRPPNGPVVPTPLPPVEPPPPRRQPSPPEPPPDQPTPTKPFPGVE